MKISLLYIMCLFCLNSRSQNLFNIIIDPNNNAEHSNSVLELADGYVLSGGGLYSEFDGWRGIKLVKTAQNGDTIWIKKIGKEGFVFRGGNSGSLIKSMNDGFTLCGYYIDSNSTDRNAALYKFDDDGNLEWMKVFGGVRDDYFSTCAQASNGDYVLIGYTASFGNAQGDYYLVKTDSLGNLKWQKTYGGSNIEIGAVILIINDGYVLGGGSKTYGPGSFNNYILFTDTSGNVVSSALPNVHNNRCGVGALVSSGISSFVAGSCSDSLQHSFWVASYIHKLDNNGEVEWRRFFKSIIGNDQTYRKIRVIEDEMIIVAGEETYAMDSSYQYGWIIKLDKDGNKIWERLYSYPPIGANTIYDIKQTTDGGFICTGNAFEPGFSGSNFWLLKLDSLGCLGPDDCGLPVGIHEPATIHIKNAHIQIVPNPAQEQAIIAIKANDLPYQEIVIQLHELSGRLVQQNTTLLNSYGYGEYLLSKDNLPAGVYLISIHAKQGIIGRGKIMFQ